jgi:hypothetical protein
MSNDVFTNRRVRIQCPVETPNGIAASIVDVETGDEIPNVFRVVITVDAEDINKAEITYYESNEQGNLLVKDDAPVVQTVTTNNFETDIAAIETKLEPTKHNGNLDDHDGRDGWHAAVELEDDHSASGWGKTVYIYGGYSQCESSSITLDPKQALSLLSWLQQEKPVLERLIQEGPRD